MLILSQFLYTHHHNNYVILLHVHAIDSVDICYSYNTGTIRGCMEYILH